MATTTQTIDSDSLVKVLDVEQTIDSDSVVQIVDLSASITSASVIISEVSQTIFSDVTIKVNAVDLKLFKESDLSTEIGTSSDPLDFGTVEAGTSVLHPDNQFILFNDKGGTLSSVDAREITISVLELNIIDELVGNSDGNVSQVFTVAFPPVDTGDAVTVKVNDVEWTSVSTFVGTNSTDEVYVFDFTLGQVTFGDDLQGKIPPIGNSIKISYTPDTILRGKEVSEQLWVGVQSNGVISNTVTVVLERVTPTDQSQVVTLRTPVTGVTGVFINSDPNRLGTNFFSGGSFDGPTGIITLGTNLPDLNDVLIDYTYEIEDDAEATFTQIGRTTTHEFESPIPSNNGKKLNFRIVPPTTSSPSSPQTIRFKLSIRFLQ